MTVASPELNERQQVHTMQATNTRENLMVSTRVLYDEFVRQHIPIRIVSASSSMLEYTAHDGTAHFLFSTTSDKCSAAGLVIANNKSRTEVVARELGIPVPEDTVCNTFAEARAFYRLHGTVVLKPLANSGGRGVSTNINTLALLQKAYKFAKQYGTEVIVQQHMPGADIRLLVVAGKFVSAVIRRPAHVVGDGDLTLKALVALENVSLHRNDDSSSSLMHIDVPAVRRFVGDSLYDVPAKDTEVRVVGPANVSLGGSLHEATDLVTPAMIHDAENITQKLRLGLCGVDMMWDRTNNTYALIEANGTPGIDIHNDPFSGTSSDAAAQYVRWLAS